MEQIEGLLGEDVDNVLHSDTGLSLLGPIVGNNASFITCGGFGTYLYS